MSPATASARAVTATRPRTIARSGKLSLKADAILRDVRQRAVEALAAQVRKALAGRSYRLLHSVGVHVDGGVLRLTGEVSTYYQKQLATASVLAVDGVERLQNDLQVRR